MHPDGSIALINPVLLSFPKGYLCAARGIRGSCGALQGRSCNKYKKSVCYWRLVLSYTVWTQKFASLNFAGCNEGVECEFPVSLITNESVLIYESIRRGIS
jgi:hypothetical protein